MKFVADQNPKKVQIMAETAEEGAWIATLREGAKRIRRGAEKYAIKAFNEWRRNPPKPNIDGLAATMMGGPKPPTKADRRQERLEALKSEGREALTAFENAMGLDCREARGTLIRVANELHQRLRRQAFLFFTETREEKAWEAYDWLRGVL